MTDSDPFPEDTSDGQLAVHHPDDHGDDGTLEVYPPDRGTSMQAADFLDQHVAMLGKAWRIADVVCQTPAAPKAYRGKPKEGTVAILYGAEVGLPPMAALQKVINVNGNPGLEARTMKGLLKTKGFKFRTITKTADVFEIWAWEPGSPVVVDTRPTVGGDDEPNPHYGKRINPDETSRWDMDRARLAKFCPRDDPDNPGHFIMRTKQSGDAVVDGNMKYIEQPIEMLEAKGTADVCRSIAPEVLLGLPYAAEERDDWAHDDDDEPAPARRPAKRGGGVSRLREKAKAAGAKAAEQAGYEEPQDAEIVDPAEVPPAEPAAPSNPYTDAIAEQRADEQKPADSDNPQKPIQADVTPQTPGDGQMSQRADPQADAEEGQPSATASADEQNPSPGPTITSEEGVTGEDLPGPTAKRQRAGDSARPATADTQPEPSPDLPATPASDDLEMSEGIRARGEKMLTDLLAEGKIDDDDDQFAVIAEILTKIPDAKVHRPVEKLADVGNRELKAVVDVLRTQKAKGKLTDYLGEGINAASLREAGMLEEGGK